MIRGYGRGFTAGQMGFLWLNDIEKLEEIAGNFKQNLSYAHGWL